MTERRSAENTRNAEGEYEHGIDQAQMDAAAARMRASGFSYQEIANAQNVVISAAHGRVRRALAAVPVEAVRELRQVELDRMDDLVKQATGILRKDHPMISHGRLIAGVFDVRPKLLAIQALLRISESRRRLLGLDEPIKHEVRVNDKIVEEIERLAMELGIASDGVGATVKELETIAGQIDSGV